MSQLKPHKARDKTLLFSKAEKTSINPMQSAHNATRCNAHARTTGQPCKSPAMNNGRCRMHGGKSTGAPTGKANGNYKHGKRTQERLNERREIKELIREAKISTKHTNKIFRQFEKKARDLSVKWQILWELCNQNDGGVALMSFIINRLHKTV